VGVFLSTWALAGIGQAAEHPPEPNLPDSGTGEITPERQDPRRLVADVPVYPQATGGPDIYGYTWDDGETYTWIDVASTGTAINFTYDNDFVGPLPLGFSFPFYENNYTEVYVSANGLLTFGGGTESLLNRDIPFPGAPQNLIAPFWDDLDYGQAYYLGEADKFVVAWHDFNRYGAEELVTFETILHKNGEICFQYQDMNGTLDSATVGIEDGDGVDGLAYLYNASGIENLEGTQALCFQRPGDSHRVKALPNYQGGFLLRGQAPYEIVIHNTGTLGVDSFDLNVVRSDNAWAVNLYDPLGRLLTTDSNNNGDVETGNLEQGEALTVTVVVQPPENAAIGSTLRTDITASSLNQPAKQWVLRLDTTLPAPFVQSLVDSGSGIDMHMIVSHDYNRLTVSPQFTGSTLSVTYLPGDQYLYLWEQNGFEVDGQRILFFTDIGQSVLNGFGYHLVAPRLLISNQGAVKYERQIFDRAPTAAVTPNGKIGLVWVKDILDASISKNNFNIYFAVLDVADPTTFEVSPMNLTENDGWWSTDVEDVPRFFSPHISETSEGYFAITYTEEQLQDGDKKEGNISLAIYTAKGQPIRKATKYGGLTSIPGTIRYREPDIVGMESGHLFLSYEKVDDLAGTSEIGYAILDNDGNTQFGPILVDGGGVEGRFPTAKQLSGGPVLLAWIQSADSQVAFALIDQNNYGVASGPKTLATPDGRSSDYISITQDPNGRGILTWLDADLTQRLYYALVNQYGKILTSPMVYFSVSLEDSITISEAGRGNAPYDPKWRIFTPGVYKDITPVWNGGFSK
jgi:hypothetical protein